MGKNDECCKIIRGNRGLPGNNGSRGPIGPEGPPGTRQNIITFTTIEDITTEGLCFGIGNEEQWTERPGVVVPSGGILVEAVSYRPNNQVPFGSFFIAGLFDVPFPGSPPIEVLPFNALILDGQSCQTRFTDTPVFIPECHKLLICAAVVPGTDFMTMPGMQATLTFSLP